MKMTLKKMRKRQRSEVQEPASTAVAFAARLYSKETEAETVEAQLIPPWERRVVLADLEMCPIESTSPLVSLLLD